jgi:putative SOS response-associated peptidase YedK
MCGRFTQERPTAELAAMFEAEALVDEPGARFNVAPMQRASVVVQHDDRRAITAYRWGLVPSWAKDERIGSRLINARAETVATTPAFRDSFRHRRCLVPADGFYEWRRIGGGRQPYAIRRADGSPLVFAGLWSSWRHPDVPDPLRTFAIVTTVANDVVAELHDRMPVVLPAESWRTWLDSSTDPAEIGGLLAPCAPGELITYPVATLVNNVRNEGRRLIEPVDLELPVR